MALGGAEVDEAALGDEVEALRPEVELLDVVAHLAHVPFGQLAQRDEIQLGIEVTAVGQDGAVAHGHEVLAAEDVDVAGGGDEDLAPRRGLADGHDLEAVHQRLERAHRVDLDDGDVGAVAAEARGDALADPAVAGDDDAPAGDQDVGRAQDAVERRLAGPVAVVEEVLRLRLVDGDDREAEGAVGGHGVQPDDAGRRLLGAGQDLRDLCRARAVEERDEVAAVVHGQVRVRVGDRVEVGVVGVAVLAPPGIDGDPVVGHERRRHVVLRRERVGGGEDDLRSAGLERAHQVGGLGRDVEAGADAQPGQRLLGREPLADEAQDRHLALRPLDPPASLGGQAEVGHVVGGQRGGGHRSGLLAGREEASKRSDDAIPARDATMRQALLEADVLAIPERPVGGQRRRVVGADVEHDLFAGAQQLLGHGAGDLLGEATAAVVGMRHDVADDAQPGRRG